MNILLFGCVRLTICQYVKFFNFLIFFLFLDVYTGTAALPDFRKLYGIINKDVPKGSYQVTVLNSTF